MEVSGQFYIPAAVEEKQEAGWDTEPTEQGWKNSFCSCGKLNTIHWTQFWYSNDWTAIALKD
jgi:hypothetical protein